MFNLHPRLDYNMGDMVAAFYPAYARAEVEVDFPGSWLKTGTNSISFQAVPEGEKGVPDAGFEYDAIELQRADPRRSGVRRRAYSFRDSRIRTSYAGQAYCGCEWAHGACTGDPPAAEEMDALSCPSRAS